MEATWKRKIYAQAKKMKRASFLSPLVMHAYSLSHSIYEFASLSFVICVFCRDGDIYMLQSRHVGTG